MFAQRTWAENDVFECFYSVAELFSLEQLRLHARKRHSKGLRPAVFVPRTLRRTWGTPPDRQRRRENGLLLGHARCHSNLDRNLRLSQLSLSMKSTQKRSLPR
jgi:hypothetical protein